jgi:DNA invertase Pin-like site-specific DNA recombinase
MPGRFTMMAAFSELERHMIHQHHGFDQSRRRGQDHQHARADGGDLS